MINMPLDPALLGSLLTGLMGLVSQAIGKCKCHVACMRDEEGTLHAPSCVCGFLDASLFENLPTRKDDEDLDSGESRSS